MDAPKANRTLATALLALFAILPCLVHAKSTTEDPNSYQGAWFRIVLSSDGRYLSGDGHGYGVGTWYNYPQTGWYRQWFYNRPFDATGKGYVKYDAYLSAVDPNRPTYIEINVNWTTPQWSGLRLNHPPLPKDADTALKETDYMFDRGLYRVDNQSIKPGVTSFSFTVDQYCPEWVSVDVRGRNAYIYGGVIRHDGSPQGACCNHATGECSITSQAQCKAPNEWLGAGTTCDQCTRTAATLDFGDAPDASYKTSLASDGARHVVAQGVCLGQIVDAEVDAKPGPAATGDDLDGQDDEDGVVFTSALTPGETATIEVTASTRGYLNAWVDFDRDNSFADAGERVFADQILTPGVNKLSFTVPQTAAMGATFARFRFNSRGLLSYQGLAQDGEVEDYRVAIAQRLQPQVNSGKGGLKWSQGPQQFDPATPFIFNAWTEVSSLHLHQIAADDWRSEDDRPITGFQWWGSFEGWTRSMLPLDLPLAFHIAIWTDSPEGKAGDSKGLGHPDMLVWETYCTRWTWNLAGYDSDPERVSDDTCFQFTCLLSQDQWFYPQPPADVTKDTSTVYWLSIAALYDTTTQTAEVQHPWGWTTRPQFFNAGAVQIGGITPVDPLEASWPPGPGSRWTTGGQIELPKAAAWDLAFELLTNQGGYSRDPDLAPVYRFWSSKLGAHFYTIDEAEKDRLISEYSHVWSFEGVAFYAYPPDRAPVGSKPVYRFWSDSLGRHFYSISESEKQRLVQEYSRVWTLEGVAWHAFD